MYLEVISIANDSLIQLIKKIALDAVTASKPCNVYVGEVVDTDHLKILVNQKLALDDDFLILADAVKSKIKKGAKVIMIREPGGLNYYVIDAIAGGGTDDT